MAQPSRAFLDEIVTAVPVSPGQSAAIVAIIARRLDRWISSKNPSRVVVPWTSDIALHREGHLWWYRGRNVKQQHVIPALGELLAALIQRQPGRTPAGLLYVVARATDPRHLAPFPSLREFEAALERHAPEQKAASVDALLAQYFIHLSQHPALGDHSTISDIRRLRRAGGVTLQQIAGDTGIPLSLLRELEWGLFTNWDPRYTTRSLQAYAERAGLDPSRVAAIIRREHLNAEPIESALVARSAPAAPQRQQRRASHRAAKWTERLSRREGLPFALAGALVFAVALAAPDDPRATEIVAVQTPAMADVQPASLVETAVEPQAEPAPSTRGSREQVVPRRPRSGRSPAPPSTPRPATQTRGSNAEPANVRRDDAPRGLSRLARVIVGDGRYKVEPFPRVQN